MNIYQSVQIGESSIQISYIPPDGIDEVSGIAEVRVVEIPHEVIGSDQLAEFVDQLDQIMEAARVARRRPEQSIRR